MVFHNEKGLIEEMVYEGEFMNDGMHGNICITG